ncbi:hypothetical protein L484_010304 [Morus notabilis]|uniref:Uncharacterized protein n=1 Tax=Morus notabilis TaxID=981085 RepID=W9QY45_9ROSA|nr:hypothetical protein L484_010304 [Morus notabilis]
MDRKHVITTQSNLEFVMDEPNFDEEVLKTGFIRKGKSSALEEELEKSKQAEAKPSLLVKRKAPEISPTALIERYRRKR